jgi:hypothetical protein
LLCRAGTINKNKTAEKSERFHFAKVVSKYTI